MLKRVAQHYAGIQMQSERKYRILAEAKQTRYAAITQEIGEKEGEYIRLYTPALNTQIPHVEDWCKFDLNKAA